MRMPARARSRRSRLAATAVVVAAVAWPATSVAQEPRWPSSSQPRALKAREVVFPPYETRTLANGLTVAIVPHREQPMVSLRLLVRAGSAQDPAGKHGLASMVATLLDQGTTTKTAQQVAETIDFAGGDLTVGGGRDLSYANVTVMTDSLDLGVGLLADVVRRPAFAGEELERQRKQVIAALRIGHEKPEYLAGALLDRLVFGSHPYGYPKDGTPATVETLTREDLVRFHDRYYVPNNCLLAVAGDVSVDQAMAAVGAAFGDWPRRDVPAAPVAVPPKPARRVVIVDKPDAVQTEIRVGHIGVRRKSNDVMAVDLAIRILGGEGANRVYRVLRAERGLTYTAAVDSDTLKASGLIVGRTSTKPETTAEAVRVLIDEFWRLRREGVAEEELAGVKSFLTGRFPLTVETPNDIASQVLEVLFYDLPAAELQSFRRRVEEVTVDDIERVAFGYVQPGNLSVVLVGNAAAIVDQVKRAGLGRVDVVRLPDLDLIAPDFTRKGPAGGAADAPGRRH